MSKLGRTASGAPADGRADGSSARRARLGARPASARHGRTAAEQRRDRSPDRVEAERPTRRRRRAAAASAPPAPPARRRAGGSATCLGGASGGRSGPTAVRHLRDRLGARERSGRRCRCSRGAGAGAERRRLRPSARRAVRQAGGSASGPRGRRRLAEPRPSRRRRGCGARRRRFDGGRGSLGRGAPSTALRPARSAAAARSVRDLDWGAGRCTRRPPRNLRRPTAGCAAVDRRLASGRLARLALGGADAAASRCRRRAAARRRGATSRSPSAAARLGRRLAPACTWRRVARVAGRLGRCDLRRAAPARRRALPTVAGADPGAPPAVSWLARGGAAARSPTPASPRTAPATEQPDDRATRMAVNICLTLSPQHRHDRLRLQSVGTRSGRSAGRAGRTPRARAGRPARLGGQAAPVRP